MITSNLLIDNIILWKKKAFGLFFKKKKKEVVFLKGYFKNIRVFYKKEAELNS